MSKAMPSYARAALCLLALLAPLSRAAARDILLPATGEAAIAQPMVVITLGDHPTRATKTPADDLENLGADLPAIAVLDTGASTHVLSHGTATRFGITPESGSHYVETGS